MPSRSCRRPALQRSASTPASAARASVPRRDRAGPAPRLIASSRPRWSPMAASDGTPEAPLDVARLDAARPARPGAAPTRSGNPARTRAADVTPGTVSVEPTSSRSQRLIVSSTTGPGAGAGRPPRRRNRAARPRAPRASRTPAASRRVGRPGQHREPARARQRLAQRPRAQPAGGLQHRVPADPVGGLEPEHPVDARADRVGVDQQRRSRPAAASWPARTRTSSRPLHRNRRSRRSSPRGPAPPSPTSVSSSTSQVSEAGSAATVSAPTRGRRGTSRRATSPEPTTCTPSRRGGRIVATSSAHVGTDEDERALRPSAAGRRRGRGRPPALTPPAAARRCRSASSNGSRARGVARSCTDAARRPRRLATVVRHALWRTATGSRTVDDRWAELPDRSALPPTMRAWRPADRGLLRPRQDDHREVEHARVQPSSRPAG